VGEQDLLSCNFVFNDVCSRMNIRTILDHSSQAYSINRGDALWERKLFSHEDWHTDLVGGEHRVR